MSAAKKRRFVMVSVPFSESEYRKLVDKRALMPIPTVASVIRDRLGLSGRPYGWRSRQVTLTEREFFDDVAND